MHVSTDKMAHDQAYSARAVVGRLEVRGHYYSGVIRVPIYQFITLYQGEGREAIPVEFKHPAPMVEDAKGDKYLDMEALREGDFVISPGLVYRKCLWFDNLMAAHMKALQTFRPKVITVADKDDAPAVDVGMLDFTTDKVTKH